ncbi:MAG: GNAT family N-acetyltransferase [Proteobacteria bacterium]|nr:MAG: GNAT family N-acetyltransferase [Pseudomonadota bacterium]
MTVAAAGVIRLAQTDEDIARCHPVMRQLRPHLEASQLVAAVRRQAAQGYRLALREQHGRVVAVAGWRIFDNLMSGRVLYVDDLVSDADARSQGHGAAMFDWLVQRAREAGCRTLELDSGVQRFAAHRFYLRQRMVISSHHFRLSLE